MDGWRDVLVSAGCVGAIACMGGNLSSKGMEGWAEIVRMDTPIIWMETYMLMPIVWTSIVRMESYG